MGRVGSCSLTLLCLGLASDVLCVLVKGMYCIAISAIDGIVAIGFGKSLGSIPTSIACCFAEVQMLDLLAYVQRGV